MSNELLKSAFRSVSENISINQLNDLRLNRHYYDRLLLNTPSGKEKKKFEVGQIVISTGTGTYKAGVSMEITEVYDNNGYFRYVCGHGLKNKKTGAFKFKCDERQNDLKVA